MLQIFRVLLPSWKFFDGTVDAPVLYYRAVEGEWIECIPKANPRSLAKLFINTRENYLFACHALLEYLKNDLTDKSNAEVSIELVKNLVEFEMQPKTAFQFRLECKSVEYTSIVYEVTQK